MRNEKYIQFIKDLFNEETKIEFARLSSSLKTTKLMTRLRHRNSKGEIDHNCENSFDILYFNLYFRRSIFPYAQLVVTYITEEKYREIFGAKAIMGKGIVLSDLKQNRGKYSEIIFPKQNTWTLPFDDKANINVYDSPIFLEAVTNYDKDFRKEWEDGCLVYEGNEYGDTSKFCIIGYTEVE